MIGPMRRALTALALGTLVACTTRSGIVGTVPVYNFGTIEQGTPVQHQFALQNVGRTAVQLQGATSSCGCTMSDIDGRTVRGGQIAWVNVSLDTTKLSGNTTKTVIVRTSNPRTPRLLLALTGTVLTDLRVSPTTVYLGRIWRGDPARHELVVSAGRPGNSPYSISSVETTSRALNAYVVPGDKPGQQKVVVEVYADAPAGRVSGDITIHTTSPTQTVITVPVIGQVLA
jgi:Protein of unknown function (DUF1573)